MDLFVARQPIFDLRGEVAAYELLYRRGAESRGADGTSTNQMSLDVIIQSFVEIGLDRITHGRLGFINFSREMLLEGCYELLDREAVVIELLEDVQVDAAVEDACRRLVRAGYRLALDDFEPGGGHEALLPLAEIVKLDVLSRSPEKIAAVAEPLRARKLRLLAERVETAEVRDHCRSLGFEYFQGYYFSRPEIVAKKGIAVEQTAIMELMNLLRDESAGDQEIEDAFRRDPSLSYKLLRMVNAAASGTRGVESILHGIRILGRGPLHRWLSLLLASSLAAGGGVDAELVHAAVLRARFCELLAERSAREVSSGGLFMVGLFSLMDSLLRTPMEEILEKVKLSDEVRAALLGREGPYADWLRLVEAYEAGEWEEVTRLASKVRISPLEVPGLYLEALGWAREKVGAVAE